MQGRYLKYRWDTVNASALCVTQAVANGDNLIFNGALRSTGINNNSVNFVDYLGYSRSLLFTSPHNLSDITFHIKGTQNGGTISESITGPDGTTNFVDTVNFFDTVQSITVTGGNIDISDGIRVGTGAKGAFKLIGSSSNIPANISMVFPAGEASYNIYYTSEKIAGNGTKFNDLISQNRFKSLAGIQTDPNQFSTDEPYLYLYCSINTAVTLGDPIIDLIYYEPK